MIAGLIRRGVLRRIRRGWLVEADECTPEQAHLQNLHAALSESRGSLVASHHSALVLAGVETYGCDLRTVHLTRRGDGAFYRGAGLVVHERDWSVKELASAAQTAPLAHAIVQTSITSDSLSGLVAADRATRRALTTKREVESAAASCRSRAHITEARVILGLTDPASESVAETVCRFILWQLGFTVVSQAPLDEAAARGDTYGRRADFHVVGTNLLIEVDGLAKWRTQTAAASERVVQRNQRRDAWLMDQGWVPLHLYWSDLVLPSGDLNLVGVQEAIEVALRRPGVKRW